MPAALSMLSWQRRRAWPTKRARGTPRLRTAAWPTGATLKGIHAAACVPVAMLLQACSCHLP